MDVDRQIFAEVFRRRNDSTVSMFCSIRWQVVLASLTSTLPRCKYITSQPENFFYLPILKNFNMIQRLHFNDLDIENPREEIIAEVVKMAIID